MEVERRILKAADLEVRRAADEKTTLAGRAVVYGSLSEDLGGFRERIAPGAFSESLRGDPDVRALVDHDPGKILGRTRSGTLTLSDDDDGVSVSIQPPDTQVGRDVTTSVERGDLSGMSFGFRCLDDAWTTENGKPVRTVRKAELIDVSVVAFPSYPETSIAKRSLSDWQKESKPMEAVFIPAEPRDPEVTPTTPERRSAPPQPATHSSPNPAEWRDLKTGKEVRALSHNERFADLHRDGDPLSMGRAIRAMICGDWSSAPAEHRALSTVVNATAGILAPSPLAATVIDKARALTVLSQAGARTIAMPAGDLTIARVDTDPTFESKAENVAFTGSDVSFDSIGLTAYTIGTVVTMSRELAQDAPNSVQLIEDTLARSLAAKLDYYGLRGTGSAEPLGLLNFGSTNTESVGGAVDWDNLLNGIAACETDNHYPNAWIVSPTEKNLLSQLKVAAEANHYASAPADVSALRRFVTSAMPDTTIALGDFSKFLIGLRQAAMIEVTTEGGNSFEKHQVLVKVVWRGCFASEDRNAFCLLTGIS